MSDIQGGALTSEEKNYAMLAHLLALAGLILPFGSIIGPLVIWLIKKDESPFVDKNGKESLNFQISTTIYWNPGRYYLGPSFLPAHCCIHFLAGICDHRFG